MIFTNWRFSLMTTYSNECPITFEPITNEEGILVISFDGDDQSNASIHYYQNKEIFLEAYKIAGSRCPMTHKHDYLIVPLSHLSEPELASIMANNTNELQTGALLEF